MWKYIVTWTILITVPCEENKVDEYGREPFVTLSIHCQEVRFMSKEFYDRQLAIEFHDIGNYNKPLSMEIDSVYYHPESQYMRLRFYPNTDSKDYIIMDSIKIKEQ